MSANLVWSGRAVVQSDNAAEPTVCAAPSGWSCAASSCAFRSAPPCHGP
jgi:hypothetical protein